MHKQTVLLGSAPPPQNVANTVLKQRHCPWSGTPINWGGGWGWGGADHMEKGFDLSFMPVLEKQRKTNSVVIKCNFLKHISLPVALGEKNYQKMKGKGKVYSSI